MTTLNTITDKQNQAADLMKQLKVSLAIQAHYPKAFDVGKVTVAVIGKAYPPTDGDYSAFTMRFKDHAGNILGVKSFNELGDVLQAHVIKQVTTGVKK